MRYANTRRIRECFILITTCLMLLWHNAGAQNVYTLNKFDSTVAYPCAGDGGPLSEATFDLISSIAFNDTGSLLILDEDCSSLSGVSPSGTVVNIAGNGTSGYSGDGFYANLASLNRPTDVTYFKNKSIYIADQSNYCVRKIDSTGIITTVAGTPGVIGYGGDGGPATNAFLSTIQGVAIDKGGNVFITDMWNYRIRKVDTFGNISTIAGTGVRGHSGDGGLATNAQLDVTSYARFDSYGDLYFIEAAVYVRRIDTNGIITTVAGNGVNGHDGDGGPATSASFDLTGLCFDTAGSLLVCNFSTIRKISPSGFVSTVAGDGRGGYSGDGGPAISAEFYSISPPCCCKKR
jgi:hypothetical protein